MSDRTKIEWATATWSPVIGCSKISEGCTNCYAEKMACRLAAMEESKTPFKPEYSRVVINGQWAGNILCREKELDKPLHWKKSRMIFVCSMGDLFHPSVPFEFIDKVMAVISLCSQHQFQVLTKRPERVKEYFSDTGLLFRIIREMDAVSVKLEMCKVEEKIKPIEGYNGYFISNTGYVYSSKGSSSCVNCGQSIDGFAKSKYCSKKCKSRAEYIKTKTGKYPLPATLCKMSPDIGKQGHQRIMLYKNTAGYRFLVHRLVLEHFDRQPKEGEQACHRDSNPTNNHIFNLRWGTQGDNWLDSKRHGTFNRHHTQNNNVKPQIDWPLPNLHLGVTAENQRCADERIPILLKIPAAVRFVSIEPILEDIRLRYLIKPESQARKIVTGIGRGGFTGKSKGYGSSIESYKPQRPDWIIVGCETGPKARISGALRAIINVVEQCKDAGIPVFVKAVPVKVNGRWKPEKDMDKWPDSYDCIRLREFPK